jgi:hypothetical protein
MKRHWFWATLLFWTILTSTVISWALIYAPVRFNPETISHFETQLNGMTQEHYIWMCEGNLTRLLPSLLKKLQEEGWTSIGNGMDFGPSLLGFSNDSNFSDHFQIKIFQKEEIIKTIGLWEPQDEEKTYGWTCDTPKPINNFDLTRMHWNFPFKPPSNSNSFYLEQIKNIKIAIISIPRNGNTTEQFQNICSSQGFAERPFESDGQNESFILTKSNHRLLAELESNGTENLISVVSLN